jgi:hypothetical protein
MAKPLLRWLVDVNWRTHVSTSPERIDHESRLVAGVPVRITELTWPNQRRSYEVHLLAGDVDLTENGCFDDPPTDAQIRALLANYDTTTIPPAARDIVLLRKLLSAGAARVGWRIDLDQLPITGAHTPGLVVALVEACATHLAALAAHAALTDAGRSIRDVITGEPDTVDWFAAELLGRVAGEVNRRGPNIGHTRRTLIAALQALQPEGAAWPPEPHPPTATTEPAEPDRPNPSRWSPQWTLSKQPLIRTRSQVAQPVTTTRSPRPSAGGPGRGRRRPSSGRHLIPAVVLRGRAGRAPGCRAYGFDRPRSGVSLPGRGTVSRRGPAHRRQSR